MNWFDFLTNILGSATGGGVLGLIGAIWKGKIEIQASKARIEEKRVDAEIQRELIKLKADTATIEGEAKAFQASQESTFNDAQSVAAAAGIAKTPAQRWLVLVLESLRNGTRPLLTWTVVLLCTILYFQAPEEVKGNLLIQFYALMGTVVGWWFGSRTVFRFNK